jgi:hypothetical protein
VTPGNESVKSIPEDTPKKVGRKYKQEQSW